MSNTTIIELNFKTGVLKELYKRQLITRDELERAMKIIKDNAPQGSA
ncbi:MAG: hypothetical protein LBH74_09750 [Nitrososphaerota archaeon]|nr:hypothetical protein [Nitrososphaerota archaeon]